MSSNGGGALAFLNQGSAPSASSNYSQSSSQIPDYLNNYQQQALNIIGQYVGQNINQMPLYQGARIAQQDQNTQNAYGQAGSLVPTANQNTQASQNLVQGAANSNNPLATAQPYLNAGTDPTYNTVQNYMNPYNQDVTQAIANAGNTNFQTSTLPGIQSAIVGGGNVTGASTEGAQLATNAATQNQQAISNAQSQALQSGYNGSLSAAQAGNANALTAAGQAASANEQQTALGTNAGSALANIGTQGTQNQISGMNEENTLGLQNQGYNQSNLNLAYQDFLNQENWPLTLAGDMQSGLAGMQFPTSTVNYSYGTGINGGNGSAAGVTTSPLNTGLSAGLGVAANLYNTSNPGTTTVPT